MTALERRENFEDFVGRVVRRAEAYARLIGIWPKDGSCHVSEWFSIDYIREVVYCDAGWVRCDPDATLHEDFAFEVPLYVIDAEDSWEDRALAEHKAAFGDVGSPAHVRDTLSYKVYKDLARRFDEINGDTSNKRYSGRTASPESVEIEREAALIVASANRQLRHLSSRRYMIEADRFKNPQNGSKED